MNAEKHYKYLKFVEFYNLIRWDVKTYINSNSASQNLVCLGDYIKEQSKKVKLFDFPEEEFGILGVNNQIGIFDAYFEKGCDINQPYKEMQENWLAYNPYRINVGSIGIKTKEHKYKYISPAYVVFSCKETLLPEFLFNVFKTDTFNKMIIDNTTGSVRQNLSFTNLAQIQLVIPPLTTQKQLVEVYQTKIELATQKEQKANELEKSIDEYLIDELDIEVQKQEAVANKYQYLRFIDFEELGRWDFDYNKYVSLGAFNFKSKYEINKLTQAIDYIQYGTSNKANTTNGIPVLRMNNILNGELNLSYIKYIDDLNIKGSESLFLNKGDILFNRTNGKELVGKTCVFDADGQYIFASYLIRISLKKDYNPYYINHLFCSNIIRNQINAISRQITGQANINSIEMSNLLFPLPPLAIQSQIATHIGEVKTQIKALRREAEELRINAKIEFEKVVFE